MRLNPSALCHLSKSRRKQPHDLVSPLISDLRRILTQVPHSHSQRHTAPLLPPATPTQYLAVNLPNFRPARSDLTLGCGFTA